MGELYNIVFSCKVILKGKRFVVFVGVVFIVEVVFLVENVKASPPPNFFIIFIAFLRSNDGLHTAIIERLGLILSIYVFTRLTMLNLAIKLVFLFLTLKLYHCVNPFVFTSFCSTRS